MLFHLAAPHYLLVCMATYVYKPRLRFIIDKFKKDLKDRCLLIDELKTRGFDKVGSVYSMNMERLESVINKTYSPYQDGGFIQPD